MVRVITGAYAAPTNKELTGSQRRRASRRLTRRAAANPLRRVVLVCETTGQRDATATVGDLVWCDRHQDFAKVATVVE